MDLQSERPAESATITVLPHQSEVKDCSKSRKGPDVCSLTNLAARPSSIFDCFSARKRVWVPDYIHSFQLHVRSQLGLVE